MADLGPPPNKERPAYVAPARAATAAPLTNANFSKGLLGWKVFQTKNGVVLGAEVVRFALKEGAEVPAVTMAVGQRDVHMLPNPETGGQIMDFTPEGGGVTQDLQLPRAGRLSVRVDVASTFASTSKHISNADAGLFEVLVDDKVVARKKFEGITLGGVERATLEGKVELSQGKHVLAVRVSRGLKPSLVKETDGAGRVTKEVSLRSYFGELNTQFEAVTVKP